MQAKAYIAKPDETDATIILTMSLGNWKQVAAALSANSESGPWQVNRVIGELVAKMQQQFYPRTEE